jgi:hypothetical protein
MRSKTRLIYTGFFIFCMLLMNLACTDLSQFEEFTDSDGDGWSDAQENLAGTDPQKLDTDDDGYWDPHDANPLDRNIPVAGGASEHEQETIEQPSLPDEEELPVEVEEPDEEVEIPENPPENNISLAAQEIRKVQKAVEMMMRNNNITELENPVTEPTNNMHKFPDALTKHGDSGTGYVLYLHDFNGDGSPDTNYYPEKYTGSTYTCDRFGNVTQITTCDE